MSTCESAVTAVVVVAAASNSDDGVHVPSAAVPSSATVTGCCRSSVDAAAGSSVNVLQALGGTSLNDGDEKGSISSKRDLLPPVPISSDVAVAAAVCWNTRAWTDRQTDAARSRRLKFT